MYVDIIRKDGKLRLENLSCDCDYDHNIPDMDIYIKSGLLNEVARCVTEASLGKNIMIVADEITDDVAGKAVEKNLADAGYVCSKCILHGEHVEPTPQRTQEIVNAIDENVEFLLSVGSGVLTDLTRRASMIANLPFAVFGTAASMDGYTSVSSSMMIDGMKLTVPGKAASLVMFDPAVLATAPPIMQAAGVGDMFAKYNSMVDWKLGSTVAGETFCPLCAELLTTALDTCTANIDEIVKRSEQGMEALIEALILAGMTMLIVRYSRPVASLEHNISHYFEMASLAYGGSAPSHGVGVGIGLVYSFIMHDMLRAADLSKIDKEKIRIERMTKEEKRQFILDYYPPGIGEGVMEVNHNWFLEWPDHEKRIDALIAHHEQYKKDCEILPSYQDIIDIFNRTGAPYTAKRAGISKERLKNVLTCAHEYRPRYSIGTAVSELGMLSDCIDKIMEMEDTL